MKNFHDNFYLYIVIIFIIIVLFINFLVNIVCFSNIQNNETDSLTQKQAQTLLYSNVVTFMFILICILLGIFFMINY